MSRQSPRCIRFALPLALLTLSVVSSAADAQQSTGRRILAPTTAKSGAQPVAGAQEATGAQSATSAQAASNSASPASGCDFETADGFSLPFETCRAGNASGAAFTGALTAAAANGKEVEIVEYRNGDSQHRQRVIFEGRDRNALIARVLRVGPVDPGDVDGDGLPEVGRREGRPAVAGAAARRSKQAESATHAATVVLVANSRDGVNALQLLWQARGGGPRAMSVQYLAAGSAPRSSSVSVRLERCRPFRFTQKSAPGSGAYTDYEMELACTSARVHDGTNPWALLLSSVDSTAAAQDSSTVLTNGGSRNFDLHGVRARSWSVEYLPENTEAPHRWTLEVRVQRIEMS